LSDALSDIHHLSDILSDIAQCKAVSQAHDQEKPMRSQIEFALAHPVFDPGSQIVTGHYWRAAHTISACLTVNIGME
jgi:hypothetical protein